MSPYRTAVLFLPIQVKFGCQNVPYLVANGFQNVPIWAQNIPPKMALAACRHCLPIYRLLYCCCSAAVCRTSYTIAGCVQRFQILADRRFQALVSITAIHDTHPASFTGHHEVSISGLGVRPDMSSCPQDGYGLLTVDSLWVAMRRNTMKTLRWTFLRVSRTFSGWSCTPS